MASKTNKLGTRAHPFPLTNALYVTEMEPGWYRSFFVERQDSNTKTWEWQSSDSTKKEALVSIKKFKDEEANGWVNAQVNKWREENTHNQQAAQLVHFKVTAKTTQDEIDAHTLELQEHTNRLKSNPPVKMPKFKSADAPISKYRIVVRTVLIEEKVEK